MNKTTAASITGLLVLTLAIAGAWYQAYHSLRAAQAQFVAGALEPMVQLLTDNEAILAELQAEPYIEKDNGILESYLIKIRRDGVPKNASMKQRLDQLAENNTALVTLISAYLPSAKTNAFKTESNRFQHYAVAWRDRWNSVMELFMAGGNYPSAAVPFPKDFPAAVRGEIAAAR